MGVDTRFLAFWLGIRASSGAAGVASERYPHVELLLEGPGGERLPVQGGAAERHGSDLRQDLGKRQSPPLDKHLGYLRHDAVPELLGVEAVKLVLDLGEVQLNAPGLGMGGERSVPGLRSCSLPARPFRAEAACERRAAILAFVA